MSKTMAILVPVGGILTVKPDRVDGTSHLEVKFPNGYGASVIRNRCSYGGPEGFYELAVIDDKDRLTYKTPITDDVLGWLTPDDVTGILRQIAALKTEPA